MHALRAEPDQTLTRKGVCPCVCYCASVCVRRECWELSLVLKRELINKWQNTQCLKGNASNRRNIACLKFYLFFAKIVKILKIVFIILEIAQIEIVNRKSMIVDLKSQKNSF